MIMKKIILIIAGLLILTLFIGGAMAIEYEITSELEIVGINCSLDRELDAQTEYGYAGIILEESFYTKYLGTGGGAPFDYHSIFGLYIGNSTQFENETTAEIEYSQTSDSISVKHYMCGKNYELGAAAGFVSGGDAIKSFDLFMDPVTEELGLEAKIDGRIVLMQKVADPDTRFVYVDEVTRVDGKNDIVWSTFVERLDYPAGDCDWLGCP